MSKKSLLCKSTFRFFRFSSSPSLSPSSFLFPLLPLSHLLFFSSSFFSPLQPPSQVAQWQRLCLPMQETQKTQVWSLGQEMSWKRKWHSLQYSCLEDYMDRWAWRATVLGVTKNQTWLSVHPHPSSLLLLTICPSPPLHF